MTDPVLLGKRLSRLREYVRLLRILANQPREKFTSDPFVYGNAERYLQLGIQVVLDISTHIVADERLGYVEEYRDALRLLGEKGVLPLELSQRLMPLAGLRNILVHDYLDVDRNRLYDFLQRELGGFEELAVHIGRLL